MAAEEKVCKHGLAVVASRNDETDANCVEVHSKTISLNLADYCGMTHLPVLRCS